VTGGVIGCILPLLDLIDVYVFFTLHSQIDGKTFANRSVFGARVSHLGVSPLQALPYMNWKLRSLLAPGRRGYVLGTVRVTKHPLVTISLRTRRSTSSHSTVRLYSTRCWLYSLLSIDLLPHGRSTSTIQSREDDGLVEALSPDGGAVA
jgi:hypothetical protein